MNNLPHADPNLAWSQIYSEAYFIWLNWIYFNIVYGLVVFLVSSATHPYTASDCFLSSFLRSSLPEVFCNLLNWQENNCVRVSFLIKLLLPPATLLKKRLSHRCFFLHFAKFLRTPFFKKHLWWLLLLFSRSLSSFILSVLILITWYS